VVTAPVQVGDYRREWLYRGFGASQLPGILVSSHKNTVGLIVFRILFTKEENYV
jgi:hypothetical protein